MVVRSWPFLQPGGPAGLLTMSATTLRFAPHLGELATVSLPLSSVRAVRATGRTLTVTTWSNTFVFHADGLSRRHVRDVRATVSAQVAVGASAQS